MVKVCVYLQVEVFLDVEEDAADEDILGDAIIAYYQGDYRLSTMVNGAVSQYDIVEL